MGAATPAGRTVTPARHREARHLSKYAVVGASNVAIDFLVYAVLLELGVWYLVAKVLSVALATLNGYTWNRRWTFRAGAHRHGMLVRYVLVQGGGMLVGIAVLAALVELGGQGKFVSSVFALPAVALFTFTCNRLWTFGPALTRG